MIHGGTEMLRSKGLAPIDEFEIETASGPIQFKGRDDTYNMRAPNRFLWDRLEPGSDAAAMRDWWRGLIALRLSGHGAVFRVAEVPEDHYRFITPDEATLLGYVAGGRVLVLANSGPRSGVFDFELPGAWRQVADRERIDLNGVAGPTARLSGGRQRIEVPAGAFLVWVAEVDVDGATVLQAAVREPG
jgi:hypothetical protein